jgi:pantetheine-phosphate adenylyltransferase
MKQTAIYTGSFDPFHLGHEDIVRRAAKLFEKLVVGVGENPEKRPRFSLPERVEMIREVVGDLANVSVEGFQGLTVAFAKSRDADVLLRGIRALADIEYEFSMSLTNASLDPSLETVFLMSHKEFTHLSSSLIRQIAELGGELDGFVPPRIKTKLEQSRKKTSASSKAKTTR